MLISDEYRALNAELHTLNKTYGTSGKQWVPFVRTMVDTNGYKTILDYGCGKGLLKRDCAEHGIDVIEYDPAIPGKDAAPEPAELVMCTDVLEHIEPVHLNAVLKDLRRVTQRRAFVIISTQPACKALTDGRNAHLIIQPGEWWRHKLLEHFQVLAWVERGNTVGAELTPKKHTGRIKAQARRRMTPEIIGMFEDIKSQINANSDAFSQISEYRMWESIDDEPADLLGVVDILDHVDDIDAALAEVAKNTRKVVFIAVKPDHIRTEADWRRTLELRFRAAAYYNEGDRLIMLGAPAVLVQGITAVGAVDTGKRWDQVLMATKRTAKRIEPAPAHDRRAIVACYGPSLAASIDTLKAHIAEGGEVVSVSGSHDFLLKHGIVPTYHIECDPRPHKSDNIDKAHPDVQYLIATSCHEVYFDKLGPDADVRLWHVSTPEHTLRLINELGEDPKHIISGGGSVGLRSVPLLYAMGYRTFSVFAMDCSFADEGKQQWAGKHAGKRQDVVQVQCGPETFYSSPILLTYATNFFEMVQKAEDIEIRLYGTGLLQSMAGLYMGIIPHVTGAPVAETAAPAPQPAQQEAA